MPADENGAKLAELKQAILGQTTKAAEAAGRGLGGFADEKPKGK